MNRPTRPFVVESEEEACQSCKTARNLGDLDLSALTAGALAVTELTSEPAGNVRDRDRAVEVDCTSSTGSAIEIPSEDGDAHAIADANPAEAHPTDAETEGRYR